MEVQVIHLQLVHHKVTLVEILHIQVVLVFIQEEEAHHLRQQTQRLPAIRLREGQELRHLSLVLQSLMLGAVGVAVTQVFQIQQARLVVQEVVEPEETGFPGKQPALMEQPIWAVEAEAEVMQPLLMARAATAVQVS